MGCVGTLYLEGKKMEMFTDAMEWIIIVETQAKCKEFINSQDTGCATKGRCNLVLIDIRKSTWE